MGCTGAHVTLVLEVTQRTGMLRLIHYVLSRCRSSAFSSCGLAHALGHCCAVVVVLAPGYPTGDWGSSPEAPNGLPERRVWCSGRAQGVAGIGELVVSLGAALKQILPTAHRSWSFPPSASDSWVEIDATYTAYTRIMQVVCCTVFVKKYRFFLHRYGDGGCVLVPVQFAQLLSRGLSSQTDSNTGAAVVLQKKHSTTVVVRMSVQWRSD